MAFLSDRHAAACPAPRRQFSPRSLLDLARQRRALGQLDDARLRDIGLSRNDAMQEARRPFWDTPVHW